MPRKEFFKRLTKLIQKYEHCGPIVVVEVIYAHSNVKHVWDGEKFTEAVKCP